MFKLFYDDFYQMSQNLKNLNTTIKLLKPILSKNSIKNNNI